MGGGGDVGLLDVTLREGLECGTHTVQNHLFYFVYICV